MSDRRYLHQIIKYAYLLTKTDVSPNFGTKEKIGIRQHLTGKLINAHKAYRSQRGGNGDEWEDKIDPDEAEKQRKAAIFKAERKKAQNAEELAKSQKRAAEEREKAQAKAAEELAKSQANAPIRTEVKPQKPAVATEVQSKKPTQKEILENIKAKADVANTLRAKILARRKHVKSEEEEEEAIESLSKKPVLEERKVPEVNNLYVKPLELNRAQEYGLTFSAVPAAAPQSTRESTFASVAGLLHHPEPLPAYLPASRSVLLPTSHAAPQSAIPRPASHAAPQSAIPQHAHQQAHRPASAIPVAVPLAKSENIRSSDIDQSVNALVSIAAGYQREKKNLEQCLRTVLILYAKHCNPDAKVDFADDRFTNEMLLDYIEYSLTDSGIEYKSLIKFLGRYHQDNKNAIDEYSIQYPEDRAFNNI